MITVEALNWKTKEQCRLPEIPTGLRIHSGTVLYGTPVVCGGLNYEVPQGDCYKLKEEDGTWESVSFRFLLLFIIVIIKIKLSFFCAAQSDHNINQFLLYCIIAHSIVTLCYLKITKH
jgi:hypothetical protein